MNKLVIANWKMNGSKAKIQYDLNHYLSNGINNFIIAVPYIYLPIAQSIIQNSNIKLSSQNISIFNGYGAYTGEVSASILHDLQITYAIINHSERRKFFNETLDHAVKKIINLLQYNIIPIFCIGETLEMRNSNQYQDDIIGQLNCLKQINYNDPYSLVIAYEPIWSIGSGITANLNDIKEIMIIIRSFMQNYLPHVKITTIYGGSVNHLNIQNIFDIQEVDGVLVGNASLQIEDFSKIYKHSLNYNID